QTILACPDRPSIQAGAVAGRNLLVGGGAPNPGYTFSVPQGASLPGGLVLDSSKGIIRGNGNPSTIPPAGTVWDIPMTITDNQGSTIQTAPGTGTYQLAVQNPGTGICGLPIFVVLGGPIPLTAQPGVPYGVTLAVDGLDVPSGWG